MSNLPMFFDRNLDLLGKIIITSKGSSSLFNKQRQNSEDQCRKTVKVISIQQKVLNTVSQLNLKLETLTSFIDNGLDIGLIKSNVIRLFIENKTSQVPNFKVHLYKQITFSANSAITLSAHVSSFILISIVSIRFFSRYQSVVLNPLLRPL